MAILTVGPGQQFSTISAAVAAAQDGDTVQVQAGTYTNDFPDIWNKITLEAVGGQVNMVATQSPPNGKAILVVDNDATIKGFTFSGCTVPDANGAGIRYEAGNLVLQGCTFEHNQEGLLAAPDPAGSITIDHCEFGPNGDGSGYTHNLYVNEVGTLTVTNSYFHDANVGHEIKSRADNTIIQNNTIDDGSAPTSYSIDLPDGGNAVVSGNTIVKGANAENQTIIHYGGEGLPYADSSLSITGNTVTNDRGQAILLTNQTLANATISDNTLINISASQVASGASTQSGNVDGSGHALADDSTSIPNVNYDYLNDSDAHTVTGGAAFEAMYGGAGHLTVTTTYGYQTVLGGTGGVTFDEVGQSGANTIFTKAGSTNTIDLSQGGGEDLIDSAGTDTITLGGNHTAVNVSGTAVVNVGSAMGNQLAVTGTAKVIEHGGSDFETIGAQGTASITGSASAVNLNSQGGNVFVDANLSGVHEQYTVIGGSFSQQDDGDHLQFTTSGGGKGVALTLGAGDALINSNGADTIRAGAGTATVIVTGAAQIYGGSGALGVFGRGTQGATVHGAGGSVTLDGNGGNLTYIGGTQAAKIQSNLSCDSIVGGAGRLTITSPGWRETVNGGSGGIVFSSSTGGDLVTTAAKSFNTLALGQWDTAQSYGRDSINLAGGNDTANVHGTASVTGGPGHSTVNVFGNAIITAPGALSVGVMAGGMATVNDSGAYLYTEDHGGTAAVGFTGGGDHDRLMLHGDVTVMGTAGNGLGATTAGGTGSQILEQGGSLYAETHGDDTVTATGYLHVINRGNATIHEQSGTLAFYAEGGAATVSGGAASVLYRDDVGASLVFHGGTGAASLNGGWGSLNVTAGRGNITLTGGAQTVTAGTGTLDDYLSNNQAAITFGSGQANVTAQYNSNAVFTFVNGHGGGNDVISGFDPTRETLAFKGFGGNAIASDAVVNGSTQIKLTDGTRITLTDYAGSLS